MIYRVVIVLVVVFLLGFFGLKKNSMFNESGDKSDSLNADSYSTVSKNATSVRDMEVIKIVPIREIGVYLTLRDSLNASDEHIVVKTSGDRFEKLQKVKLVITNIEGKSVSYICSNAENICFRMLET